MRFCLFFFLILRKLCDAPSGSTGVDDTEIIFHSPFGNPCTCPSLVQNSVSLIQMPRVWKHLPTETLISHHLLVKPSWVAFRVEHSKHQKVSISQILLTRKSSSWIQSQVRIGEHTEYPRHCCFLSWFFSTMSDIIVTFIVNKNSNNSRLFYFHIIFIIFQTLF